MDNDSVYGYAAILFGVVAVIAYCLVDDTAGWWGLVFALPLLLFLALVVDAPKGP